MEFLIRLIFELSEISSVPSVKAVHASDITHWGVFSWQKL